MRCFQRSCILGYLTAWLMMVIVTRAAETNSGLTIIEMTDDERFVGQILREDVDAIHFSSATAGEITLPRTKIRTITAAAPHAAGFTSAPTATPAAAAAATTPSVATAPSVGTKSTWRQWLHLPDTVTASVAAGASVKAGVVDQRSYTAGLTFGYETPANVFNSVFQYEYVKAGALVAADDYYWDSLLQHNLGTKTFVLVGGRYRHDSVMAIDRELNVFAAPGFYLTKTARFQFGVAGGLSWLYQDYGAGTTGGADPGGSGDLGAAVYQFLQFQVLPRVQITQNNLFTQSLDESGKYIYRFLLSATLSITDHLSLINMYAHGYDSRPAQGVEHGQDSLTTQLSYRF